MNRSIDCEPALLHPHTGIIDVRPYRNALWSLPADTTGIHGYTPDGYDVTIIITHRKERTFPTVIEIERGEDGGDSSTNIVRLNKKGRVLIHKEIVTSYEGCDLGESTSGVIAKDKSFTVMFPYERAILSAELPHGARGTIRRGYKLHDRRAQVQPPTTK